MTSPRSIVIVSPAIGLLASGAGSGNGQTAQRWADMLRPAYPVRLACEWPAADGAGAREDVRKGVSKDEGDDDAGKGEGGDEDEDAREGEGPALLIALHARRSARSVAAWRAAHHPARPLLLVLTGTDLYRDIDVNAAAQASLAFADALVVLNARGAARLPAAWRSKCHVLLQSCPALPALAKPGGHLRALMVGHLRDEKDPRTYFAAARRLAGRCDIALDHIGAALDPALGAEAIALAAAQRNYRWLGALPPAATRRHIQRAHLLVQTSRIEGGAHVVTEALRSGTPVLASRIDGNLGLLCDGAAGTFDAGDDAALAALLVAARDTPDLLPLLRRQAAQQAPLFAPAAESAALHRIVGQLLQLSAPPQPPPTTVDEGTTR